MSTGPRILAVIVLIAVAACSGGSDVTTDRAGGGTSSTASVTPEPSGVGHDVGAAPAPADGGTRPSDAPGDPVSPAAPGPVDPGAGAGAGDAGPATTTADASPRASAYAPPPGRYHYDNTGTIETTGIAGSRRPVPPTSTDDVRTSEGPAGTRMSVVTRDAGEESSQEIDLEITDTEVRLTRLTYRTSDDGLDHAVEPDPPALVARLPYRVGDAWEIAWSDPTSGVSGVGTGTVERREAVRTPAGTFDTIVITVVQRLRGTVTGSLSVTSWIDPATGVQARQHVVTDFQDATGASRRDVTRTLRERPS